MIAYFAYSKRVKKLHLKKSLMSIYKVVKMRDSTFPCILQLHQQRAQNMVIIENA